VGLYLGEHDISAVRVAATPLGPVIVAEAKEPYTSENLPEVVERVLVPLLGPKRRAPVAVGLTVSRLFFGTRLTPTSGELRPEAELQKALCTSNITADDLVIDLIRDTVNKLRVARMVASRTKYMTNIIAMFNKLGVRPYRTEPSPCAIERLAEHLHKGVRRSKGILRIFLGASGGLAVLVAGGMPLAWKSFVMTQGMESFAIISAARGLVTQQMHFGIPITVDYAMIHGRSDLHEQLQQEQLPSEMKTRTLWFPDPDMNGTNVAFGLALGCLAGEIKAFDLSRTIKTRAPIKEIFPWKETVFATTLVAGMGALMFAHTMQLDETFVKARGENSQHVCLASGTEGTLENKRRQLDDRVKAVRTFLETRMQWSAYLQDVPQRLPSDAVLTVFAGRCPLDNGGKVTGSFQIRGTSPLSPNGGIPANISTFLQSLPKDPLWSADFSTVNTDIKVPLSNRANPQVNFSVFGQCKGRQPQKKK
jgi:hypothetical protein